ncbi:MAG TPA: DUF2461 domain-containing protein [Chloroflexota bacterium]|nr:DUF2461 domain-containing protein [Chloroflexota bacterium]
MAFAGFRPEAARFLVELAGNNNRAWFQDHGHRDYLLEPANDLVAALGERLHSLSEQVHAEPRINGSIHRINRDIRFSKDKSPYKTHLDLWFWQGDRASRECPGYFFRLTARSLMLGAGMHTFDKLLLERYRQAVVDERRGAGLERAIQAMRAAGPYELGGRYFKRVPAGFDPDHSRAELLLHAALYAGLELSLPPEVYSSDLPALCLEHYRNLAPLQEWIAGIVLATQNTVSQRVTDVGSARHSLEASRHRAR